MAPFGRRETSQAARHVRGKRTSPCAAGSTGCAGTGHAPRTTGTAQRVSNVCCSTRSHCIRQAPISTCAAGLPSIAVAAGGTGAAIRRDIDARRRATCAVESVGCGGAIGDGVHSIASGQAGTAGPTGTAISEEDRVAAMATAPGEATVYSGHCHAAGASGPAVAVQQPAGSPVSTGRAWATGPAGSAIADQPGTTAGAASHPGSRADAAGSAVAVQQPPGPAGLSHTVAGASGRAVADQRASQQRLCRSIDHAQCRLLRGL
ncbi:hypothetical protein LAUMK191_05377 [Mycobacterium attenuatum]|nr:hypothetical protein LAUMK191_05377 [Mycobacterium attenuatum]